MKKLVLYSDQIPSVADKIDKELITILAKTNPIIDYIPSSADLQRKYYNERQEYYSRRRDVCPLIDVSLMLVSVLSYDGVLVFVLRYESTPQAG